MADTELSWNFEHFRFSGDNALGPRGNGGEFCCKFVCVTATLIQPNLAKLLFFSFYVLILLVLNKHSSPAIINDAVDLIIDDRLGEFSEYVVPFLAGFETKKTAECNEMH